MSISSQAHLHVHVYFIVYSVSLRMTQPVKQQLNMYEANKRLGQEFFRGGGGLQASPGESPQQFLQIPEGSTPSFGRLNFQN